MDAKPQSPTLGTLLRHLIEMLDGAVLEAYSRAGLNYRPRYTPVFRALMAAGPSSIRAISLQAHISHSAASQTVSQMEKDGLVELRSGKDARERVVTLTPAAQDIIPALKRQWAATNAAAEKLDGDLSSSLSGVVREAIAALERKSFAERIQTAAADMRKSNDKKRGT
jgi:DNA-binding MarR family transcriptional regulator